MRPLPTPPPPADQLLSIPGWSAPVRAALSSMIARHGRRSPSWNHERPPLAALDWDETCITGDISETLLAILDRDDERPLVEAYEASCRSDLRTAYVELVHTLCAGRSEREVRDLGLRALDEGLRSGRIAFREPMRELVWALHRHGWDVWIVTASPTILVHVAAQHYGVPPDRVVGMEPVQDAAGRFQARVREPITFREGKVQALRQAAGRGPLFAAGDSVSDEPLLEAARYRLLFERDASLCERARARDWWVQEEF